jgi:peptidoglycan/xylan/chitin deacetylase (PgdA/CDA1 family)
MINDDYKWPSGKIAAVSLTYDDGLESQFENALPQLDRYGIKGTFFPSTWGLANPSYEHFWKQAVINGHEIGCHTLNHPCSQSFDFVKKGFSLEDYDIERMGKELKDNILKIRNFGYKKDKLVFSYPCGQTMLGNKMDISYKPLINSLFSAARGTLRGYAVAKETDIFEVMCFGVEEDGQGLINIIKGAEKIGAWVVILFHGVGGDYISVTSQAHEILLEYLKNNEQVWTADFGTIAEHIGKTV